MYTLVGCGAAGVLLTLDLLKHDVLPSQITIVYKYFDGGALLRSWSAIYSNTTCQQIVETLQEYPLIQAHILAFSEKYQPTQRVQLADIGLLLQKCIKSFPDEIRMLQDTCQALEQTETGWKVVCSSQTFETHVVFLCQGGQQKQFDVGTPSIPLEVALDSSRLSRYVQKGQRVVVFGLAHSGTLLLKSLVQLKCSVTGIYKGKQPFLFARDGHYDGIKEESAEIADEFLKTMPTNLEFIKSSDYPKVIKAVQRATWIVPSIGFEASPIHIQSISGEILSYQMYSPNTGEIQRHLYGFGLAYPGVTVLDDGIHKDVSLPSFKAQIQRCLPAILSKIRNGLPLDGAEQNNQ
jgi:hypothetical protein